MRSLGWKIIIIMKEPKDLINWVELSRYLSGNESSVSRTRCPKKYQKAVDSLIDNLKAWEEKIKEKPDNQ